MNSEVPDNVCGTLSGVTQRLSFPSWTQWTVRLVTELDMGEQFSVNWIWSKFGQLDSVKIRPLGFGEILANKILPI